jgi:hypothetical protein
MRSRAPSTPSTNAYRRVSYRGARVLVQCVKDAGHLDALFAMLRYHPFLTNSVLALPRPTYPPLSYRHPNHLQRPCPWAPDFRVKLGRLSMQDCRYERDDWLRFTLQNVTYGAHPVGTCKMGVDDLALVDPELRVHGVEAFRVVDASVMPTSPWATPTPPP